MNSLASFKTALSVFSVASTLLMWGIYSEKSKSIEAEREVLDRLTCLSVEETRTVKMKGHLAWDQCYVVSVDADENTELHTIQCIDTLKFNYKGKQND